MPRHWCDMDWSEKDRIKQREHLEAFLVEVTALGFLAWAVLLLVWACVIR